jgi:hypothetical protein
MPCASQNSCFVGSSASIEKGSLKSNYDYVSLNKYKKREGDFLVFMGVFLG